MKKYIYLLLCIVISYPFTIYAQFDPKPQIQKPSSDAQSLGKFGEIPVDLHTGRVNINIPIYTVKYYDVEVPISISYHGGGIKVSDECGSVGLGWTLNVGGVISRIARGMPDDLMDNSNKVAGYDKLNSLTINGLNQFKDFIQSIKQRFPQRNPETLSDLRTPEELDLAYKIRQYGEEYDGGHFDTSPDNYSFNVQRLSGTFVYKDNSLILQSNDGVTIAKGISGYTITDENGYIYQFNDQEKQTYFYKVGFNWSLDDYDTRPEHCYKYTSSWWLSSIISPTGEVVKFVYTDAKIVYPKMPFFGYTQGLVRRSDGAGYSECFGFNGGDQKNDTTYKKLLNRIETPNSVVQFNYETSSLFYQSPKLNSIAVFARINPNQAIEKTKFVYGGGPAKAKLLKLVKQGAVNSDKQTHIFSYEPASMDSPKAVNDTRVDHWGYYAPASSGTFPRKNYSHVGQIIGHNKISFSNRNANNATASNEMLSKITYPTGGKSEFVWEPHSYSQLSKLGGSAPQDGASESGSHGHTSSTSMIFHIEKELSLCGKLGKEIRHSSYEANRSYEIRVDLSKYYPLDLGILVDQPATCISYWYEGNTFETFDIGDKPHILIKKDGKFFKLIHICAETARMPVVIRSTLTGPGAYTFELKNPREAFNQNSTECKFLYDDYFNRPETNYGYVNIQFGYESYVGSGSGSGASDDAVGGVRIKRITNKSENGTALIKEYNYLENPSDPNSRSSGVLAYQPRYGSFVSRCMTVGVSGETGAGATISDCPILLTLRSNGLPYSMNGGSHIEYSKVIESVVQTSGLSFNSPYQEPIRRTVYSYWTSADNGCSDIDDTNYQTFVPTDMLQLTNQSHYRGHLKEKIEYTDERRTSSYNYEILEQPITETITGSLFTVGDYTRYYKGYKNNQGVPFMVYKDLGIVQYRVIPYNKRLLSVTSEGTKSNDYQAYTYANNQYSNNRAANAPLSHSTVDSEGDTITQHFTYVNVSLNRIHTCVTVKKGKIIDAYRNEYDAQGRIIEKYTALLNSANLPSAKGYNAINLTNKLIESYLYENNRLVQLTDHQSGLSTVYLWSYKRTYPIAEIQNATFSAVRNILGESTVNNLYNTFTPDMTLINNLRDKLKESMVSTMTYDLLKGITSFTSPKGAITYYTYNDFGQLKECYIIENSKKKIIQKMEYHWSH